MVLTRSIQNILKTEFAGSLISDFPELAEVTEKGVGCGCLDFGVGGGLNFGVGGGLDFGAGGHESAQFVSKNIVSYGSDMLNRMC